jgi:hypothetical protein
MILIPSRVGLFATFQASEGEPMPPVLLPVLVKGDTLEIVLPDGGPYTGKFVARFSEGYLTGQFESGALAPDGSKVVRLRRGKSYWQRRTTVPPR